MVKDDRFVAIANDFKQVRVHYDRLHGALWYTIDPRPRPCFNLEILAELRRFQEDLVRVNHTALDRGRTPPVRYTILASRSPGIFNLGGDLELFHGLITAGDRQGLLNYATACIDVLYPNAVHFDLPVTTISLVQGEALGGGCEAAISSNVIIAERGARFGLPEIMFNLIPGMGAYSFLIRRTTPEITKRLITTGKVLTAAQMHKLGLVDILAEDGQGHIAVQEYLASSHRRANAYHALNRVRQCVNPITYEELMEITRVWVDTALQLRPRDLKMISRLLKAQKRRAAEARTNDGGNPSKVLKGKG